MRIGVKAHATLLSYVRCEDILLEASLRLMGETPQACMFVCMSATYTYEYVLSSVHGCSAQSSKLQ